MINDYNVANKYYLIWQTYFMLKYLNQNIINKWIIITLRKPVTEMLSQTTYSFFNIWEIIMTDGAFDLQI
jgi:hypothetical protein